MLTPVDQYPNNQEPTLSGHATLANRKSQEDSGAEGFALLKKNYQPSNIEGAGNPDGFTVMGGGDALADEGFQVLRPVSDRPEKAETFPVDDESDTETPKGPVAEALSENPEEVKNENDHFVAAATSGKEKYQRIDEANPALDDESPPIELTGAIDWEKLWELYNRAGLPKADFPDRSSMKGPEATMIAAMLEKEIQAAAVNESETSIVRPDVDGMQYDVKLEASRIENPAVRKVLSELIKKYGPSYLTNIWTNANSVDVYNNRDGQNMIMVRAKKEKRFEPFFVMSTADFARMLTVPSIKDGNSRVDIPQIDPAERQDQYKVITIFANVTVNGQLIGGADFDNFNFGRR